MFRKKTRLPKQWITPGGKAYNLYLDMLKQSGIYILGHQTVDRDLVRDGFIYTALFQSPSTMNFCFFDLCGAYLNMYRNLPHTLAYTHSETESITLLQQIYTRVINRLDVLRENKDAEFPAIWVVMDGYDALHFAQKKNADNLLMSIMFKGKITNVHLALFTSYIKPSGGLDELFSSYGVLNGTDITNAKFRRITGSKITTAPNEIVYRNVQGQCGRIIIPRTADEEINERVDWWKNQVGYAR